MRKMSILLKRYNSVSIVAKATLWFVVCSVLQKGIAVITTPIFTRLMSPEQYGQFSIYTSWLSIFTIITTLRLNGAVFNKGMSKFKDDRDTYTSTMQFVTLLMAVIVFCVYLIFHKQINKLTELPTFIMIAIFVELLVTPAIDFWTVRKRYEYEYKSVVFRTLLMATLNAGVGIGAVLLSGEKGYARILSCIIVNFFFGVVLFIYNMNRSRVLFKKEYAVFALSFNLPLLLHYFSQYVLEQSDRIMVQKMVGMAAVGIYSVSYNIALLMRIVTTSINNAITPWQYECLEKKIYKRLDNTMFLIFVLVAGCSFLLSCFAPEIMKILANEKYYEGIYVIPPVAMGLFFSFMYTTFANVEFYFDKNKFSMYISCAGAILNVLLNYIGIRYFGYLAAAYTTLICYVFFAIGHYIYMIRSVKISIGSADIFNTKRLVLLSLGEVIFGSIIIIFYNMIIIRYMIVLAIVLVVYLNRERIINVLKAVKNEEV